MGGILFSKLGELLAAKILGSNAGLSMKISVPALVATALLFLVIFALIMLRMIVSVYRLKPVELLKSEKTGEKPPKANWIFAVLGLLLLGVAYYLSLTIKDPLVAMIWFMVAVVLVILATYLLFIAGSVTFCKIMQKKKGYYYKNFTFIHDLPYETKWGRISVYLYSVHNGSGYGIFYNQPVSEYGTWLESSISEICPD